MSKLSIELYLTKFYYRKSIIHTYVYRMNTSDYILQINTYVEFYELLQICDMYIRIELLFIKYLHDIKYVRMYIKYVEEETEE